MNKVIIMGRLTADPELRTSPSGVSNLRFTVAVNRNFKNQQGEYDADFISCVAFKQRAEFISRYFSKGSMICVEGSLRTGSYTDKKHSDVTHYATDLYVDNAEFCGSKGDNGGNNNGGNSYQGGGNNGGGNYTAAPPQAAQSAVQAAQNAGIQTAPASASNFEALLEDADVPF